MFYFPINFRVILQEEGHLSVARGMNNLQSRRADTKLKGSCCFVFLSKNTEGRASKLVVKKFGSDFLLDAPGDISMTILEGGFISVCATTTTTTATVVIDFIGSQISDLTREREKKSFFAALWSDLIFIDSLLICAINFTPICEIFWR